MNFLPTSTYSSWISNQKRTYRKWQTSSKISWMKKIYCLKICSQCYDHKKQPFTMLCEQPHMIIWAEASNCPYWPAKLMKSFMKDDELHVNVPFFGDYTVYNVPASNCFLYSKNRPDENILEDNSELYQLALNVSCSFLKLKSNNRSNCN